MKTTKKFPKLKPCPCCYGKAKATRVFDDEGFDNVVIFCMKCGLQTPEILHTDDIDDVFGTGRDGIKETSTIWNTRKSK